MSQTSGSADQKCDSFTLTAEKARGGAESTKYSVISGIGYIEITNSPVNQREATAQTEKVSELF